MGFGFALGISQLIRKGKRRDGWLEGEEDTMYGCLNFPCA